MLSAWTVGVADAGRLALAMRVCDRGRASPTSVPNENWVTTSEIEFDEVDWMSSSRGTPLIGALDRLGHLLGHVGRTGPRVRRDDRDDREVDVRQELLLEAAPGRDPGDEEGSREQERDAPLAQGKAAQATHDGLSRGGRWW